MKYCDIQKMTKTILTAPQPAHELSDFSRETWILSNDAAAAGFHDDHYSAESDDVDHLPRNLILICQFSSNNSKWFSLLLPSLMINRRRIFTNKETTKVDVMPNERSRMGRDRYKSQPEQPESF